MTRISFRIAILLSLLFVTVISVLAADSCPVKTTGPKADQTIDGTYTYENWTYKFTVSNKGSRSEGYYGELSTDGKPVPEPSTINESICTPWGFMYWVGKPVVQFGSQGWMLHKNPHGSSGAFVSLPDDLLSHKLVVMAMVMANGRSEPIQEDWIKQELKYLATVGEVGVARKWFLVTTSPIVLHDSKHYGKAVLYLEDTGEDKPFVLNLSGDRTELPRKLGAKKLVKHTLRSSIASMDLYLAYKVAEDSSDTTDRTK